MDDMRITLPSGIPVTLKPMTGRAEKVLEDKKLLQNGTLTDRYMMECIETIGDAEKMSPQEKEKALLDMKSGDRNYLLLMIRVEGFGSKMFFNSECPKCGKTAGYEIDILDLLETEEIKILPYREFPVLVELPVSGGYAEIGPMTGAVERRLSQLPQNALHQAMLLRIDSINDTKATLKDLENMHGKDLLAIRAAMSIPDGGLDPTIEIDCPECGASYRRMLSQYVDFFVPSRTSLENGTA